MSPPLITLVSNIDDLIRPVTKTWSVWFVVPVCYSYVICMLLVILVWCFSHDLRGQPYLPSQPPVSPSHVIVPQRCFSTNKNLYLTFLILQTLRLSRHTLLKFTTGRVFDLVSNDVKRMEEETMMWFFGFPFAILETVVVMILLVYFVGWQAVIAVIFLCLLAVYFAALSYASAALRLRTAAVSDRRISLMNQVVCGIRAIKTHAWEDEYREKVKHIRR